MRAAALLVAAALALTGCKDERTRLPFAAVTVQSLISGPTPVFVVVRDKTGQAIAVGLEVSRDGGQTFRTATPAQGSPTQLQLVGAPAGVNGQFFWDPLPDLGPGLHRDVLLRVLVGGRDVGAPITAPPVIVDLTDRLATLQGGAGPVVRRPVAAPLADGSAWFAGGELQGGGFVSAGARFDPVAGTFVATGGLVEARGAPGAALLAGGQVLVAGGRDALGAPRPTAETFRLVDATGAGVVVATSSPLVVAREAPAIAPLPDGRAAVVGGRGAGGAPVAQVELFTPSAAGGTFAVGFTDARAARAGATATPLADGRVLIAGGVDAAGNALSEALLLDAAGTTFTAVQGAAARAEHAALLLGDGRVLLVGGTTVLGDASFALASCDLFDPATNAFVVLPAMSRRRHRPGAAYAGGFAVVFGGGGGGGEATSERLDVDAPAWVAIAGPSALARADAVAVATGPGRAVVAGGGAAPELYLPDAALTAETWDPLLATTAPRADHTATLLLDGRVLVAGGTSLVTSALATVERIDPRLETVTTVASLRRARAEHAAAALGGQVLVVGGRDGAGLVAEAEVYDVATDTWSSAGSLATPRTRCTAAALGDGTVVVSGGLDAAGVPLASQEVWSPTTRSFTGGPTLGEPRANHRAAATFFGTVLLGPGTTTGGTPQASAVHLVSGQALAGITGPSARARAGVAFPPVTFGLGVLTGGEGPDLRADVAFVDLRASPPAFLQATRPMVVARSGHEATSFGAGSSVVSAGGRGARTRALDEAEVYAFQSAALEQGASRRTIDPRQVKARARHTATALLDGRVLLVGGIDERGVAIAGAELLRP